MMRRVFGVVSLLLISGAAQAQENPACAHFKNDYEYNACLAKQGPKAGTTRPGTLRAYDRPATMGHASVSVIHNKHGRAEAVFDVKANK